MIHADGGFLGRRGTVLGHEAKGMNELMNPDPNYTRRLVKA